MAHAAVERGLHHKLPSFESKDAFDPPEILGVGVSKLPSQSLRYLNALLLDRAKSVFPPNRVYRQGEHGLRMKDRSAHGVAPLCHLCLDSRPGVVVCDHTNGCAPAHRENSIPQIGIPVIS